MHSLVVPPKVQEFAETQASLPSWQAASRSGSLAQDQTGCPISDSSGRATKHTAVGALLACGCPLHTVTLQQRSTGPEDTVLPPCRTEDHCLGLYGC